ncbi:Nucleoside diphosphate-linked moiety X motif 19, mitochondrial [Tolypocladium ophioglossoides CBS 100239]|uniref:Nucleoside diphosphate-linked moiety X motif 19, mitochondrial n=1 Tax=Tolypocladium ophioglossoides (strain CBS 100239) TaxID=1163406 RepID=A0A0L0NBC5_TOLOC|nr:Nucleoside diphosphate-linked moiety X motif 19, mitochondrial [Tolypocladium ophioglossoides CBS 100239]
MLSQRRAASSSSREAREVPEPRPSSSVLLLSPTNEVLLLHRVQSSTTFASAHVFPGGNLDPFHDGEVPAPDAPGRHQDGPAYRLGAVRECFEETGILLARRGGALLDLPVEQRDEMRKKIHANEVSFGEWVESLGGVPDTAGLIPFTRWITPVGVPKRFTTQMYVYLLPVSRPKGPSEMLIPTPDNGVEHTAALFAPPQAFLQRAAEQSIILFPPQYYLLHLLTRFITGGTGSLEEGPLHYTAQRRKLLSFLRRVPTAEMEEGRWNPTSGISWADKVMCPHRILMRESDGRVVLGLEKPGPELRDTRRGGDWERVALVRFGKGGPRDVEIRRRVDVMKEEKEAGGGAKL